MSTRIFPRYVFAAVLVFTAAPAFGQSRSTYQPFQAPVRLPQGEVDIVTAALAGADQKNDGFVRVATGKKSMPSARSNEPDPSLLVIETPEEAIGPKLLSPAEIINMPSTAAQKAARGEVKAPVRLIDRVRERWTVKPKLPSVAIPSPKRAAPPKSVAKNKSASQSVDPLDLQIEVPSGEEAVSHTASTTNTGTPAGVAPRHPGGWFTPPPVPTVRR